MAGGAYFEVEARVVAPGVVARIAALIEPAAQNIERRLQEAIRRGLEGGGSPRVQGTRQGTQYGDAFGRSVKSRIEAALRSLPTVQIGVATTEAEQKMRDLSIRLKAIGEDVEIGLDDKKALTELRVLRAELRDLAHSSPDIRVRVNAGAALAELEAVKKLASDNKRGNIFTRLIDDARASSASFDLVAGKVGTVGSAISGLAGNNLASTLALVAAIVAALSTIGPIVGALGGAFLGAAGAVGVVAAAVVGLKKQMQFGTGVGKIIQQEFKGIAGAFSGLAELAANAFGPAVANVASFLKAQLPTFQGLVTLVGGRLGGAFREVGVAVITAFQKAQPLIVQVSQYILDGAAALRRWVVGPGFSNFILYASRELPIVINFAKALGTAIIGIFQALAPLGEALLRGLTPILNIIGKVSSGIGSFITNVLGQGKTADNSFPLGAQLLKSFQDLSAGATETAAQAAPLDNYRKIIGDLVPALQLAAGNSGQFSVAVSAITDRLRSATPELQTFMDTAAAYDATSAKSADTAKLLGDAFTASRGPLLDYTAAMLAADTATQDVAKTIQENSASIDASGKLLGVSYVDSAGKFVDGSNKFSAGSAAIVQGISAQTKAATDAATATYVQVRATGDNAKAAQDALTVYKGYRQSFIDTTVAAGRTTEQAKALADQYFAIPDSVDTFVDLLGAGNVNVAIQGLTDALNRLSDFIGAPKVELNHTDLDNSLAKANSDLDYFGNKKPAPTALLNSAGFDVGIGQANNQLDRFDGRTVGATVDINDFASYKLKEINGLLLNLHDRTIRVNTVTGGQAVLEAKGGILDGQTQLYADGGVISQAMVNKLKAKVPTYAGGGIPANITTVPRAIYGEAGPEAYIPLANDSRRQRALMLWGETGRRLGVQAAAAVPDGGSSAVVGQISALRGDVQAIPGAVLAGAAHTVDGYHAAVDAQLTGARLQAAQGVRDPFRSGA